MDADAQEHLFLNVNPRPGFDIARSLALTIKGNYDASSVVGDAQVVLSILSAQEKLRLHGILMCLAREVAGG